MRHRNFGIRKVCDCGRKRWPRCPHSWYFNFKPRGGPAYRFSLDAELRRHIDSKTEAETIATKLRAAILEGTFRREQQPRTAETPGSAVTVDAFVQVYVERVSQAIGKVSWKSDRSVLMNLVNHRIADGRRLGDLPVTLVTEDEIEASYGSLVAAGRAASSRNHYVQLVKAAFRWAAKKGYIPRSPISEDTVLVRSKQAQRSRRIPPYEEAALLNAAQAIKRSSVWLYGVIVAAIETGCRLGELLALQWADVDLHRRELRIRSETAKDQELRRLPISTRLAPVLDMARLDPAGRQYPPAAHVFGKLGRRIRKIDKAWNTCVLKAHGHEPIWAKHGKLAPESRAILRVIDLHFHDLRHEAGSRWLESKAWDVHQVKEMLGHANISQTDTYLNAGRIGLHEAMKRFDAGRSKTSEPPETIAVVPDSSPDSSENPGVRCKSVAKKPETEHRPLCNDDSTQSDKRLLH